ncbi:MAG: tetratricopeptide repeat protein [Patescibacteria group bacterium]|jgi:tetratricopeptide (TPR) repeat protein|nr:tetratricopeptide repeat protein [Patescibacteria group bacterium]
MSKKKINLIISIVVLLLVLIGIGWYFSADLVKLLPQQQEPVVLSEFKVVRTDLSEDQISQYRQEFDRLLGLLDESPDDFYVLLQLGRVKKDVGDYHGAEAIWIRVGEISPQNSVSFGNLADLYTNFMFDKDKALAAYRTAVANSANEPINLPFYRNFYDFYRYSLNDMEGAKQVLLEAIANNPLSSELHVLLAQFYLDNDQQEQALRSFQEALKIDPDDELIKAEIEKLNKR